MIPEHSYFFIFYDDTQSNPQHIIEAGNSKEAIEILGKLLGIENYRWNGRIGVHLNCPQVTWND